MTLEGPRRIITRKTCLVVELGPRGRDVRRPGRLGRIGLGPKLFLAFAVVSILAVVASGVAWISYGRVERGFEEVQEQGVRPLTAALRLARQAEALPTPVA